VPIANTAKTSIKRE